MVDLLYLVQYWHHTPTIYQTIGNSWKISGFCRTSPIWVTMSMGGVMSCQTVPIPPRRYIFTLLHTIVWCFGRFPCLCSVFPVIILSMLNFLSQGLMKDVWKLQSATEGFFLLLPSTQYHSALTWTDSETLFLRDSTYGTLWKILQKLVTGVFIGGRKSKFLWIVLVKRWRKFQHQTIHKNLKCQGLNAIARTNRTKNRTQCTYLDKIN